MVVDDEQDLCEILKFNLETEGYQVATAYSAEEALEKKKDVWDYLKEKDPALYKTIHGSLFGIAMNLPGKLGRKCSVGAYKVAQKFVGFN